MLNRTVGTGLCCSSLRITVSVSSVCPKVFFYCWMDLDWGMVRRRLFLLLLRRFLQLSALGSGTKWADLPCHLWIWWLRRYVPFCITSSFSVFFCLFCTITRFLYLLQKSSEHSIWTRQGTHNPEWMNARVNINLNGMQKASIAQPDQVTVCVTCSIKILKIWPVFTVDIHWLQKRRQSGIRCHWWHHSARGRLRGWEYVATRDSFLKLEWSQSLFY